MATLKGIWVFNDTLSYSGVSDTFNFESNGTAYTSLIVSAFDWSDYANAMCYKGTLENGVYYFSSNTWENSAYKTINITSEPTDEAFITWLTANATQQATEETSGVTVEYNGEVVATIEGGNTATLPIKDKKMKSDIVITVPEAEGEVIPEFTEVEDFAVLANGADEGSLELAYSVSQDVKLSAASPAPLVSIDDANFIANNIKKDVSIFGLTGAYEAEDKATPIEVSTEAEMTALLTSGEVGGVYKYTGTTGTYENEALYVLEAATITFTINGTSYEAEDGMTWNDWIDSVYKTANVWKGTTAVDSGVSIEVSGSAQIVQLNGVDVKANEAIVANASYTSRATSGAD